MTFTTTPQTRIDLSRPTMAVSEIRLLESVTIYGLPQTISDELRDAITTLICQCVNPMRPIPSHLYLDN